MKRLAIGLIVAIVAALVAPAHASADAPTGKSQARCNNRIAGQLEGQVNEFQRHPPSDAELDKGMASLERLIADLAQEDGVLEATCTSQDLTGLRTDIRTSEAVAYLLQSDLARRKFATKCPAARDKFASGYVAAAWLAVQRIIPETGSPPPSMSGVTSQVASKAMAVNLSLPPLADASAYWVRQVQDAGRQAAGACP